jgi:hypothetical protein
MLYYMEEGGGVVDVVSKQVREQADDAVKGARTEWAVMDRRALRTPVQWQVARQS